MVRGDEVGALGDVAFVGGALWEVKLGGVGAGDVDEASAGWRRGLDGRMKVGGGERYVGRGIAIVGWFLFCFRWRRGCSSVGDGG